MPEERKAPQIPSVSLEAEPLKLGIQAIEDSYALQTVKDTFHNYEQFRSQNHDPRWNAHDALYVGWIPPKTWDGTNTPRSSLGMPITFGQVESAFPVIHQALFTNDPWFSVDPEPGAPVQEAKAIEAHLNYALKHPKADYTGNTEVELELAIKQLLLHGNGGVSIEWDAAAGHPRVEWVDLRDFYIDPSCPVPSVDLARSIIRRRVMTIDELDALRDDPRMRIPNKAVLSNMARTAMHVVADQTKQTSEALRGVQYSPAQHEWSPLPSERKVEVLIYYSKYRIIWVLNREWVAYNEKNPYGFIPFTFGPCFPFPGRFYALSYSDVIENPQRYIEALYNGHLDEMALALRPPRVRKRGGVMTPAQQRWSPGAVSEVDDPKTDLAVLYPQGATTNIMSDVAYIEAMLEKLTGVNGSIAGSPRPGNANRTATGMNIQAQGGASRLWPLVKHIEDYLIVPMLYKMYRMVQVHSHPQQLLPALGKANQFIQVGAQSFRQPVRFSISASSKMLTREKLAQVVPFLSQFMLNGAFLQGIQQTGNTVDFDVFAELLQDATGTGTKYRLIRPMNEQEQKAKQTPPPQVMMEQQAQQLDAQTRLQMGQMKAQTEIQKAQIMKQSDPQQAQMEMQKTIMQIAVEKQKAQIEREKAQQQMALDLQKQTQQLNHERQMAQHKLFTEAAMSQQKISAAREQHQQNMLVNHAQAQMQLRQSEESGKQQLEQSKEFGKHKMGLDRERLRLQASAAKRPINSAKRAEKPAKKAA